MSYKLPYPQRSGWDPSGQFRNPGATIPLPQPTNMPVGCWFGAEAALAWSATTQAGYNQQALWRSPIFDLRPELRSMSSNGFATSGTISTASYTGQAANGGYTQVTQGRRDNAMNAVPIWGGMGGHLLIQVSGLTSTPTSRDGIVVFSSEGAHVSDPGRLALILANNDATFALETQTNTAILGFTATGENAPTRFWQLTLNFFRRDDIVGVLPTYTVEAAYY